MTVDLTYKQKNELFTAFYPESKDGESAWNQIAEAMDGDAVILNIEVKRVLTELRAAGYIVHKAKAVNSSADSDALLLEQLGV